MPGLFAAGDAATRELVAGAISGGGAVNSAWALASGRIAGIAAARRRHRDVRGAAVPLGRAGLRPRKTPKPIAPAPVQKVVELAMHGLDRALWRNAANLAVSEAEIGEAWSLIADHGDAAEDTPRARMELRATAAMAATARWCNAAAIARRETRGIAVRVDMPDRDAAQAHRLLVGGLDHVWTRPSTPATRTLETIA